MKSSKIIALILSISLCITGLISCNGKEESSDKSSQNAIELTETGTTQYKKMQKPEETQKTEEEITSKDGILFEFINSNSWEESGKKIYQLDGKITNNQAETISEWTVALDVAEDAEVKNSWGMKFEIDNGKLKIKPDQNTGNIINNNSINFGIQISSSSAIDASKAIFKSQNSEISPQNNNSNNNNSNDKDSNNQNNNNNTNNNQSAQNTSAKEVPATSTNDWLSVKGNKIVDKNGKEVWLTGVNWFGYNTGTNVFDGLWAADLNTSITAIADRGFNLLRIPISTELVNNWEDGNIPDANFNNATNHYLVGMNSLEIFDYVVGQCRANGIKIMIDFHCALTDSMGHMKPLWTDGAITEDDYIRALEWMAERYKGDDTIIAYDLKNEPHGKQHETPRAKWDNSKDADNWK